MQSFYVASVDLLKLFALCRCKLNAITLKKLCSTAVLVLSSKTDVNPVYMLTAVIHLKSSVDLQKKTLTTHQALGKFALLLMNICVFQLHHAEDDHDIGSQSLDSEAPPPPPSASYTNLFDTREDVPLGGSAHSLRNNVPIAGNADTNLNHHGYVTRPSPVTGKKRSADVRAPMASQDEFSPTSPPMRGLINSPSMDRSVMLASDEKYPTTQALITDTLGPSPPRRIAGSTGSLNHPQPARSMPSSFGTQPRGTTISLVSGAHPQPQQQAPRGGTVPGRTSNQLGQPRGMTAPRPVLAARTAYTTPQYNNQGVTAGDPLGASVAPPATYSRVQPQPPAAAKYKESGYSSSSTSGASKTSETVALTGPSDSKKQGIIDVPGVVRRPMSFVKALEMSDQLQLEERERERMRLRQKRQSTPEVIDEEQRMYGSTYEISV